MDWLRVLKDYVPLFQTIIWALLVAVGVGLFRGDLHKILDSFKERIRGQTGGSSVKASVGTLFTLEIGEDFRHLPHITPADTAGTAKVDSERDESLPQWAQSRSTIYLRNRNVFLAHVLAPSKSPHQKFDIFIYLVQHKSEEPLQLESVEFYLGKWWGDKVFRFPVSGSRIGMSTSAYSPFLVLCHVVFKDGYEVTLDRYIDFEMGDQIVAR